MDITKDAERLIRIYRKIREAKEKQTAAYKKQNQELQDQLDQVERLILLLMKDQNTSGFKTDSGSASKIIKSRYWTTDRAEFNKFILENQVPELLENRVAQGNMAHWLEEHPGIVPPGLQVDRRYRAIITKIRGNGKEEVEDEDDD